MVNKVINDNETKNLSHFPAGTAKLQKLIAEITPSKQELTPGQMLPESPAIEFMSHRVPSRCDSNTALTTPYASTPLPPNMLMLLRHPQDMPLILPLPLFTPYPTHCLPFLCSRSSLNHAQSSPDLTILMLV
ncbi:hypothetical protein O181_101957 [Austropuccinia psidii MF-1]|uniref:Uncharacterized protein n=1 Tax=Austropuccinia psidii MF-1 TaxID=1389203 RepID=A0A9Q3JGZ7_9BASI|nr:hypothetical protein [Austropuccinia psidii MF-1]